MRHLKLLIIAIAAFLGVIMGEGLVRRAIAFFMCGIFSFNSTACYGMFSDPVRVLAKENPSNYGVRSATDIDKIFAQIPRVRQQNTQTESEEIAEPSNNSSEDILQKPVPSSLSSPQNSQSNSHCNDRVDGFSLQDSMNGVCIYSTNTWNKHYVTIVDMSNAEIRSLSGQKKGNIVEAESEDYFLNEAKKYNSKDSKLIAIVNGTFFDSVSRESKNKQRRIPLGIRNGAYIIQQYEPTKVKTNFQHRALCFSSNRAFIVENKSNIEQAFKDINNCQNFIGLYAPTSKHPKVINGNEKRTYVGVRDNNSTILFLSSESARFEQAENILKKFRAQSVAQLDGSSSTLFIQDSKELILGKRFWRIFEYGIPSAIAIYSEEPKVEDRGGKQVKGTSYGDPHLITFDGHRYSFQTVGEFILAKSTDGVFEVQTRQSPVNRSLSLNSAAAMRVGNDRIAFYSQNFADSRTDTPLRINGKPAIIKGKSLSLPSGGTIYKKSNRNYVVQWATGEKVALTIYRRGKFKYMDVFPFVFESQANQMVGLLGNVNGKKDDDLRLTGD